MSLLLAFSAMFLAWSVYAYFKAKRALAECRRIERITGLSKETRIADAPLFGEVRVSGHAIARDMSIVTAPYSGNQVLWVRSMVKTETRAVRSEAIDHAAEMILDDGSGRVARVLLKDATVRLKEQRYTNERRADLEDESYWEMCVHPGEVVTVAGSVLSNEGGYRNAQELVIGKAGGALVVFDSAHEKMMASAHANGIRLTRAVGIASAIGVVGSLYFLLK